MTGALRRFAFGHLAAFPVLGRGGGPLWHAFLADAPVRAVRGPHDADLLVLAGAIPAGWTQHIRALFETLALPRAALWLRPAAGDGTEHVAAPEGVPLAAAPAPGERLDRAAWADLRRRLLDREAPANRALLPDAPPAPWRGRGEHGQGGEGMMGGTPYGRPMAMTGADPFDDLMLGALPTALGPHFPGLPSGLRLDLVLQGDRIVQVTGVTNTFPETPLAGAAAGTTLAPAARALAGEPVTVAALERARLVSHLAWMADVLPLLGLAALGAAARRLLAGPPDEAGLARLIRRAERAGVRRLTRGLGSVDRNAVERHGLRGPIARAAGIADDARVGAPGYAGIGFEPVLEATGDAWARWRVRARESLDTVRLIAAGGDRRTTAPEGPRGRLVRAADTPPAPSRPALDLLPNLLTGREWAEAVTIVASLDLDPAEAALT